MKKLLIIVSLALTPVLFMGCTKKETQTTPTNEQETTESADTKEKETTETNKNDASVTKSDDLYSFQVSLNDKLYNLPAAYKEFEQNGWSLKDPSSKPLAPNQYTLSEVMLNGEKQVLVKLFNDTANELPLNECKVAGITVDSYYSKKGTTLVLPKGIGFDSTKDDVIKAYGTPTQSRDTDTLTFLTYSIGTYQEIKINIDTKSGKVNSVDLLNLAKSSDTESSKKSTSSSEVPESVTNYKAPTELTDDLLSFNANYDGVLYHMPAPVAEFEKNGWTLEQAPKEDIASRDFVTGIVLKKGNQTLTTYMTNISPKATSAKNCFITDIIQDNNSTKIPLILPKNITVGSTKADVESAYAGIKVEKEDSASYEYYTYSKVRTSQEVIILIDKKTDTVSKITVRNTSTKSEK